jgi:uncharacterized protein
MELKGPMKCPNDKHDILPVTVSSHYGQPVVIDQCPECGGIWFDQSELYLAKKGEAAKIDPLNVAVLASATTLVNPDLTCPRDGSRLFRFQDRYFPEQIVVARCPACNGIWLNRGEFVHYQDAREKLRESRTKAAENAKLKEEIEVIMPGGSANQDFVGKLGQFLSRPVDAGPQASQSQQNTLNTIVNVLALILRFVVFK